jgi:hypothetical protein
MPVEFNVERGVPIPPKGYGKNIYPWRSMETGDSFMVPCPAISKETERLFNTLTKCANNHRLKTGKRFTMRRVMEGIRVWRTK